MLWWMIGQRSTMHISFEDINENSRPVLLAIEAASMIQEFLESPSLKAIFSRVGISGTMKVTIPDAINDCGTEILKKLVPEIKLIQ